MAEALPGGVLLYTTAQEVCDLDGTKTVQEVIGSTATGRSVRLVSVPRGNMTQQINKYIELMHFAYSEQDWKFECQFGNVHNA
ncbi:MAG: hypothetical protein OEX12_10260 [Gammaproteobacteria bacterium]|nr:hypothetical protein [Gammaproteobacteria bacterium]